MNAVTDPGAGDPSVPAPARGLVLFGHGARDPRWAGPMRRLAARLEAAEPTVPVALAFLEFIAPDLEEACAQLVDRGVREIRVVPVFLAGSGHVLRDLPSLAQAVGARWPDLVLHVEPALGERDAVLDAMAAECLRSL